MTTVDKLNEIKKDLYRHMDELDDTYTYCECCGLKNYTSKTESLTKRKLQGMVTGINDEISKIEAGTAELKR